MAAVNQREFNLPGTLMRAMGHATPKPIGVDDHPGKTGGLTHWKKVTLEPGTRIVRFGQKRLEPGRTNLSAKGLFGGAAAGEWWLEYDQFERIARHAQEAGSDIAQAVGALCLVPENWSTLDIRIVARVKAPLLALRGSPNPVSTGGKTFGVVRDANHYVIKQLFIPGLNNGDVMHDALMIEEQAFLHQKARRG